VLLVAVVAGCAGDASARRARTLVAALSSDPGHLNPAITTGGGVHTAAALLYSGLLALDDDLTPVPELAERWEIEDDGRTYRFHLRRGVRWHDGEPFTAADVKFTFEALLLQYHARTRASLGRVLESIETPDDFTVVFRLRRPYAPLLQQLDVVEAPILPRHIYEDQDPQRHPANRAPVGTGPFRFVSYRPDAEIRYAANGDYFAGPPPLQSLVLRIIPDESTQVLALESGEVDWLFGVPGPEHARLQRNPDIRLVSTTANPGGSNCIMTVGFNLDRVLLQDVRVRRAIAHAVDRAQIHERVLFGSGRPADAPISSAIGFAHATGLPLPAYDTAAAARLLDAAGWRRGRDGVRTAHGVAGVADGTRLVVGFRAFPTQAAFGNLLRAQLRPAGIELRVELLEPAVFVHAIFTERDFDTAIFSYCNGTDPEIGVRRMYASDNIAPVPFSNAAGYRNSAVDSLFDLASSALDPVERRRLYRRIQEIVVAELPYLWLVETEATRAHTVRCSGFGRAPHFAATARCEP
jgi:peptide/nickel transport system substrate-binding protein